MTTRAADILGWIGAITFLLGYAFISFGLIPAESFFYQGMVLVGAGGLVIVSLKKKTYQPLLLNGISFLIAAITIIRLLAER